VICEDCGFRSELYTEDDLRGTLMMAPHVARQLLSAAPSLADALAPLDRLDLDEVSAAATHGAMHALHTAGRTQQWDRQTGAVVQLSRSGGGVPKLPVEAVRIDFGGVEGDVQGDRRHHGRPWQGVCLWSAEVIEGLQDEGHPIAFGSAGENVTVRGLDWSALTPGVRLQVGSAVLQVSSYAIPCAKNAGWFSDGGFRRMAQEIRPGRSRVYGLVLRPGEASRGDDVVVEP
jgi:MOSC domain-containing protein YiiM